MRISGWNSMVITDWPSALMEVISLTPLMPFSSFSILMVTSDSTSSGEVSL